MDIRLIALDLDDTLLDEKRRITPGVKKAIADATKVGIVVVLASGRMLPSAMPVYSALQLETPFICCNGAYVCQPDGKIIYRRPVEKEDADRVVRYAREKGLYIQYYIGNDYYFEHEGEESELYHKLCGVKGKLVEDLTAFETGSDKLLMIRLPSMDGEIEKAQAAFPHLSIARSKPFYIEINHPGATKGAALKALAEHYGFAREQVMAIGDGTNDLPMLEYAGAGVAMGNAVDEVKKACPLQTLSCNEDGVAHAIYKYALGEENGKS